jgi:hypothetical protein
MPDEFRKKVVEFVNSGLAESLPIDMEYYEDGDLSEAIYCHETKNHLWIRGEEVYGYSDEIKRKLIEIGVQEKWIGID